MREIPSRETIGAMRYIALIALSGCSWIFMERVPEPNYAANTQPQCSDSSVLPLVDLALGILNVIGGVSASGSEIYTEEEQSALLIGGVAWAAVHGASAITGFGWAGKCSEAKSAYARTDGITGLTASDETRRLELERQLRLSTQWCVGGDCFPSRAACAKHAGMTGASEGCKERRGRPTVAPPQPVVPAPRGFFCSTSTSAGFCVREKAECVRTRDVSIAAVPDLEECALVEKAWCLGERCFPSAEICAGRVADAGVCAESE